MPNSKLQESGFFFKNNLDMGDSFFSHMKDFKSVSDFLKKRKKKKKKAFNNYELNKLAMDFYLDNQVTPILNENGEMSLMGGLFDMQNQPDNERLVSELNYYQKEDFDPNVKDQNVDSKLLQMLSNMELSLLQNYNIDLDSSEIVSPKYNNLISDNNDGIKVVY